MTLTPVVRLGNETDRPSSHARSRVARLRRTQAAVKKRQGRAVRQDAEGRDGEEAQREGRRKREPLPAAPRRPVVPQFLHIRTFRESVKFFDLSGLPGRR